MLSNRFGHFDAAGRTFTVTDSSAPTPWTNVISNGRYGFVISHNGGGFSWYDNSQLNVLTRWEMDLIRDDHGRFLYLADRDSGEVWSLAPTPCRPKYDRYQCEHTLGSTTFTTEFSGVRAVWTLSVDPADAVEVWRVEFLNLRGTARRLRLASFFEWCCGVAPDAKREFHKLFFTTEHDAPRRAIVATKNMWDVPPRTEAEHWNRPWPYAAAHCVGGDRPFEADLATSDKEAFLGRYADPARPRSMTADIPAPSGFGRSADASAALGGDFTLPAGGSTRFFFLTAIADTRDAVVGLLDKHASLESVDRSISEATSSWQSRLAPTHVRTSQPDFDLLNNHWLPYQAISGRLWARTGYYQQSGAFGFRDQLQDSLVWLSLDPARCREQIRLHARHQFADGSVYHWWHPLVETGLRTKCSDDYLWLAFITAAYIKETGDLSILDAAEPFVDHATPVSLLDHCERAIRLSFTRLSPRGLPLIGSCDWNDGLSAMGVEGRGESVWLGFFLCAILDDFARIYELRGNSGGADTCRSRRAALAKAINAEAWDGSWYRYGTRDDGAWIGSRDCAEGRVHLNAQTWSILSGVAPTDRARTAWQSALEHLITDVGPLLLAPAYTKPDPKIGYITRYAPGARENGGVYMHAATWALAAACKMGDAEAVRKIWKSISPPLRSADADAYRAEPYVTPGNVDGPDSATPGRAGWTWYTGSAQWLRRVSLESVLGVRPGWDGLEIQPCLPREFGEVTITRRWRGCDVKIRFDAAQARPGVLPRVLVDGVAAEGATISPERAAGRESINVEVTWAEGPSVPFGRGAQAVESSR